MRFGRLIVSGFASALLAGCTFNGSGSSAIDATAGVIDAQDDAPDALAVVDWADTSFLKRRPITVTNATTENLVNFAVPVRLGEGFFTNRPSTGGLGINFYDDLGTALRFDVEAWDDATLALLWVQIPQLVSQTQTRFWFYFDGLVTADNSDPASVWSDHTSVFHFSDDISNGVPDDATGLVQLSGNNIDENNLVELGAVFGYGVSFDASDTESFTANNRPEWAVLQGQQKSTELWFRSNNALDDVDDGTRMMIFQHETDCRGHAIFLSRGEGNQQQLRARFGTALDNCDDFIYRVVTALEPDDVVDLDDNNWHHVATRIDRTAGFNLLELFFDGQLIGSSIIDQENGASQNALFGTDLGNTAYFTGELDEVRVGALRSRAWIRMSYEVGSDPGLVVVGDEETR